MQSGQSSTQRPRKGRNITQLAASVRIFNGDASLRLYPGKVVPGCKSQNGVKPTR